jgi:hypothetical protein
MEHLPRLANQGLEVGETESAAGVTAAKEFSSGPGLEKLDGHKSNTSYAKASAGDDIIDLVRDTENLTKDDSIASFWRSGTGCRRSGHSRRSLPPAP